MKNHKSNLILILILVICSFNINAQSRIVHFDLEIDEKFNKEIDKLITAYKEASSEVEKREIEKSLQLLNDRRQNLTSHYNQVTERVKEKNIDYLFNSSSNICIPINENIGLFNDDIDYNALKIGHLNFEKFSKTLPLYDERQSKIKSMYELIDNANREYQAAKNSQVRKELYDQISQLTSTLENVQEKMTDEVIKEVRALGLSKGYDYILDSSKDAFFICSGNDVLNDEEPVKPINIGHLNYARLIEQTPKIKELYDNANDLFDKIRTAKNQNEMDIYSKEYKTALEQISTDIESTIINVANQNNLDYVLSIKKNNAIIIINGHDLMKQLQDEFNKI